MSIESTPPADLDVTTSLVTTLLSEQMPDLSDLELSALSSGWDNAIFRLGDHHTVRLPRRELAAEQSVSEHRWLPTIAQHLTLPVPAPIRLGRPNAAYPWAWSVCPWIEGTTAITAALHDEHAAAATLGEFLAELHLPAPTDAPRNPYRGVPLRERAHLTDAHLSATVGVAGAHGAAVDSDAVMAAWNDALEAAVWDEPAVWLHGDLHPDNILVHDGRVSGVIDFGDLCAGDPACDLAIGWMLFDHDARSTFRAHAGAGVDDSTWRRARGWAVAFGLVLLAHSADRPEYASLAHRTLDRVADEAPQR